MKKLAYILGAALLLTLPSCRFISVSDELKEEMKNGIKENGFTMNGESGERMLHGAIRGPLFPAASPSGWTRTG